MNDGVKRIPRGNVTKDHARDAGMALLLLLVPPWVETSRYAFVTAAIAVHMVKVLAPNLFRAPAVLCFSFARAALAVMRRQPVMSSACRGSVTIAHSPFRRIADREPSRILAACTGGIEHASRNHTRTGMASTSILQLRLILYPKC